MISRFLRAVTVLDRWRPLASMRIASSRLLRCTKGISSVEFVIVLPLFVLFTFGIIGFSAISYTHNNMVNAARESVRRMAVADGVDCSGPTGTCDGLPRTCGTTAVLVGTAEEVACDYLADWALTWNVTATEIVNDACDSTMRVAIDTSAEDAFIIDFMGFFAPGDLLAVEVSMRKELEARCVV